MAADVPAAIALFIFGIPAALRQQKHSPIMEGAVEGTPVDWPRVGVIALILVWAIATNVLVNLRFQPGLITSHSSALAVLGHA